MRDEGILTFYDLQNTAPAGGMPAERLVSVGTAYYSHLTVGVTRLYAARGANAALDDLVRCHNTPEVPFTDKDGRRRYAKYVILEDGRQYRIDAVQNRTEMDAVDLTLVRLEDNYDVAAEA